MKCTACQKQLTEENATSFLAKDICTECRDDAADAFGFAAKEESQEKQDNKEEKSSSHKAAQRYLQRGKVYIQKIQKKAEQHEDCN